MKQRFTRILKRRHLMIVLLLWATLVQAATTPWPKIGGIYYTFNDETKEATVEYHTFPTQNNTTSSDYTGAVVIPSTVTYNNVTYAVTTIGSFAFHDCRNMSSLLLPESLKTICGFAFENCTKLTSIDIPNSVDSISSGIFQGCSNLASVTLPASIKKIDQSMFYNCSKLSSITIPSSVSEIGNYAFWGCTSLSEIQSYIEVPFTPGKSAFYKVPSSATLYVPIGTLSRYRNAGWGQFNIVERIEKDATFAWTTDEKVEILFKVTNVEEKTCEVVSPVDVEKVNGIITLPAEAAGLKVSSIGVNAFRKCSGLTQLVVPASMELIKGGAFAECGNLSKVTSLNTSAPVLGPQAANGKAPFSDISPDAILYVPMGSKASYEKEWTQFKEIVETSFAGDIITANTPEGIPMKFRVLSTEDKSCEVAFVDHTPAIDSGTAGIVSIPSEASGYRVASIGDSAFYQCSQLTTVVIPETVEKIGNRVFMECAKMESITLPQSIKEMGNECFEQCSGLSVVTIKCPIVGYWFYGSPMKEIVLENTVDSIVNGAFMECRQLESINIPSSLTSLPSGMLWGCESLKSIFIPKTIVQIGNQGGGEPLFGLCKNLSSIVVESRNPVYDSRENCNAIIETKTNKLISGCNSTTLPNSVTAIGSGAFYGSGLTSFTIPNTIKEMDAGVFSSCDRLETLKVDIDSIRWNCFEYLSALKTLTIGNSVRYIGGNAFRRCTSLETVNLGDGVTGIGTGVFDGCSNIALPIYNKHLFVLLPTSYEGAYSIAEGIETICDYAFSNCQNLTALVIPNSVTTFGGSILSGCYSLSSVHIGDGIKSLNNLSFNSSSLKSITIGNGITEIPSQQFRGYAVLESVTLGSGLKTIGGDAFRRCTALKSIKLPNSLETLAGSSFRESGLEYLVVPNSVKILGMDVVRDCQSLRTVVLGSSVESLDECVFRGASSLEVIVSFAKTPPTLDKSTIEDPRSFLVPADAVDAYKGAPYWQNFKYMSTFSSEPVFLKADTIMATSCHLSFYPMDEEHEYGKLPTGSSMTIYGLDPQSTVTAKQVEWTMPDGNYGTAIIDITTDSLTFETLPAQATSNTKAMISAHANGDDDALRFGFEWRRYDAPDLVPSTIVGCPIYEGVIAGTLNGLSSNTYYKYRPIYTSDTGNKYYGEWSAFGTADAYVYFEPLVHTYDAQNITESTAALHGYVVAGSDDVIEQGFEYWSGQSNSASRRTPQNVQTVQASGAMMNVTLTGLLSGTTYYYRTYVKTAKATTYGEERTFTTIGTTGIEESVTADIPTRIFNVYNLSGTLVRQKTTTLEGLPRGMYIINRKKIFVK